MSIKYNPFNDSFQEVIDVKAGISNINHITSNSIIGKVGENVITLGPIQVDAGVTITAPLGVLWRII